MTPGVLEKRMIIVQELLGVARDILIPKLIHDIGGRLLNLTQSYVATEIDDVREALQAEIEDRLDKANNLKLNEACLSCSAAEEEYAWVEWSPDEVVQARLCPGGLVMVVETYDAGNREHYHWWLKANDRSDSRVYDNGFGPTMSRPRQR